jgi:hypothetical protein
VLQKMYGVINKNYMGLSRQMEFHADAVAASTSGSNNMITALRKVELADSFYQAVLEKCSELYKEKKIMANLYPNQKAVARQYAADWKMELENDMPVVHNGFLNNHQQSRVNFKDQWASHPATTEREQHLSALNIEAACHTNSAWVLFDNIEHWQQQLTGKIYYLVNLPDDIQTLDAGAFEKMLQQDVARYSLPDVYNGFYDKRQITVLNVRELAIEAADKDGFAAIFSAEHASLHKKITTVESDIQLLKAIAAKQIDTKTFDFEGKKFNSEEAGIIAEELHKELMALQQQLETADKSAFVYFYNKALATEAGKAGQLKDGYADYFQLRAQADLYFQHAQTMLTGLQPLYAGAQMGEIEGIIGALKQAEAPFKEHLRTWLASGAFDDSQHLKEDIQKFLQSNYVYFSGQDFFNNELDDLHRLGNESWNQINHFLFRKFKSLLEMQAQLID